MEANPDDESAQNNFAYTSLLMDTNPGRAQTIARDLFKKHPENVSFPHDPIRLRCISRDRTAKLSH